jgi:hypothetical protein
MWAAFDFVARLILLGGLALVWWFLYQVTRETSAVARCLDCRRVLDSVSVVHCSNCLGVEYV